jgi:pyridinium-3,5-biscarboxylic acid mononucleotide synthase
MEGYRVRDVLEKYKAGEISLPEALNELRDFPMKDLSFARLDTQREIRVGYPEVVYCEGKSSEQLRGIIEFMVAGDTDILATRAEASHFQAVQDLSPDLRYDPVSRTITLRRDPRAALTETYIAVVTAGTSDIPVAEEAAVTAEVFGNSVQRIFDVGVAGLHRLLDRLDIIRGARVVVAVAGMDGALPSVIGGLIKSPVIAVPTSTGYGASLHGLSALLAMLNTCSAGVAVVNIDNGFGAGYLASTINRLCREHPKPPDSSRRSLA